MRDPSRLAQLARDAGIIQAERLRPLRPLEPRPVWASTADVATARAILTQQRTSSDSWKDPLKQKRRFLRSKGKNDSLANPENWTFSRAERSSALDAHIRALDPVGVAQAILDFDTQNEPLDVNLIYTDGSGDKRNSTAQVQQNAWNDWLEYVAGKESLDYVTLLASYPTRQLAKDRALSIALSNRWMPIVKELLKYGANPNKHHDAYFLPAVVEGDMEFVKMFLSAPNSLSEPAINAGLLQAVERGNSKLVALLIAHGADANYMGGQALEKAVLHRSMGDVALICARSEKALDRNALDRAISAACIVSDEGERSKLVETLLCAGADANHTQVQDFLLEAVKRRRVSTVRLLIDHGTSPEREDGECLSLAIKGIQTDLVEILVQGELSLTSTSNAMEQIPDEATRSEFQKLIITLLDKGVTEEALGACLARLVAKHFDSLATMLVRRGASLNHNDAECVRFALRERNIVLLRDLLQGPCVASTLAKALPDALSIRPVSVRRDAMKLLLDKGVLGGELHQSLCTVIAESPDTVDYELVDLLVRSNVSVDYAGVDGNCIQKAAHRKDLKAIQLLCQGIPSPDTVSSALPGLLSSLGADSYSNTYQILSTLLPHGALEAPLGEALVQAVERDHDGRIIDLLLEHGADVNYKEGKAIRLALSATDLKGLKLICEKGTLSQECLQRLLPHVLDPTSFNIDKSQLLLPCCKRFTGLLDRMLILEVRSLGRRPEVVDLLLHLDASVDSQEAAALNCAIQVEDAETTRMLLSKNPSRRSLSLALKAAAAIHGKEKRFDLMRLLLKHSGPGIGQDEVLLHEIKYTTGGDLKYVKLLLDHGASVNYQGGGPIQAAIRQKNLTVFDLLMSQGRPDPGSLADAFATARSTKFVNQEMLHVFSSLLRAGSQDAFGSQVSQSLTEVIDRDPSDLTIARLLLEHGASVEYNGGLALQSAATTASVALIELLFEYRQDLPRAIVSRAFERMIDSSSMGLARGFQTAQLLLHRGVDRLYIDHAMSMVFRIPEQISTKEVSLFLSHGADVNAANGTFFVCAARQSNLELFRILVQYQPNITIIIPALIRSVESEDDLVRFLHCLLDVRSASHSPIEPSTLFQAMERFPQGERLIRLLFDTGIASDRTAAVTLDSELGPENASVLVWALSRESPRIDDSVILAIIEAGNNDLLSFVTPKTRVSAMMLSVKHTRPAILRELILRKGEVSLRDHKGRSALFYASRYRDLQSAKLLMLAQASVNDGSLHEAAREAYPQIVSLILSAGHDANFPSLLHSEGGFGRTALEELCLNAVRVDRDGTWGSRIRDTMRLLLPFISKEMEKTGGRSILHFALDNPQPVDVAEGLLEFPQVWKSINDPVHQYEDVTGLVYSPTKYVEHFHRGTRKDAEKLRRILTGKKCQDRYYSRVGEQPEDAVGILAEIVAEMEKRRRMEREQRDQMERLETLAAHQREIQRQNHKFEMELSAERHEQAMKLERDREEFRQQMSQKKHKLVIMQQQELNRTNQQALEEDNRLKLMFLEQEAHQRQSAQEAEQDQKLTFKNRLLIQEQQAEKTRFEHQKKLMWENDRVSQKQHDRQLQLIDRQDESVKERSSQMRMVAEVARRRSMHANDLLALEGLELD